MWHALVLEHKIFFFLITSCAFDFYIVWFGLLLSLYFSIDLFLFFSCFFCTSFIPAFLQGLTGCWWLTFWGFPFAAGSSCYGSHWTLWGSQEPHLLTFPLWLTSTPVVLAMELFLMFCKSVSFWVDQGGTEGRAAPAFGVDLTGFLPGIIFVARCSFGWVQWLEL